MPKTGRNDLCPCGSGRKYKKCCEAGERGGNRNQMLLIVVGGAVLAAIAIGVVSFTSDSTGSDVRIWDPVHGHYHNAAGVQVP